MYNIHNTKNLNDELVFTQHKSVELIIYLKNLCANNKKNACVFAGINT